MHRFLSPLILLVILAVLLGLTFMALKAQNAHAGTTYCGGPFDKSCAQVEYEMRIKRQRRARALARSREKARERARERRRAKRRHRKATRVLGYRKYEADERIDVDPVVCRNYLAVVGSQYVTKNGAEDSAIKSWQEQVRYEHGERFMNWDTAENQQVRCVRSSIGELGSKALDMTVKFYRCEVKGKPCQPPFETGK